MDKLVVAFVLLFFGLCAYSAHHLNLSANDRAAYDKGMAAVMQKGGIR